MPQPAPPLHIAKTILEKVWFLDCPTRRDVARTARLLIKGTPFRFPLSTEYWDAYRELLAQGQPRHENLETALRVKDVRTDSGVAPITVLTKPWPCPGRCVYCPTEARMPKSYISSEPAAARALSLKFDPYDQVRQRVLTLERHGHKADKIELIVKGGTWSAYDKEYREWFTQRCFEAANGITENPPNPLYQGDLNSSLAKGMAGGISEALKANETASHRIIGFTIETRPDWVTPEETIHLRKLGVTRVELGLQIINDRVLGLTKRGTTVDDATRAIALLKAAGFKVDVHILPGQPGATPEDDLESFRLLFGDPRFRPDMVKLYPCVVMPGSELEEWMRRGEYAPLQGDELKELLMKMLAMVPRYCRVPRVVRDFPTQDIAAGNKESNLREDLESEMKRRGTACVCLRCREVGHVVKPSSQGRDDEPGTCDVRRATTRIFEERYENAGGVEVFLSVEDDERRAVFGFCRLRLPSTHAHLVANEGREKILSSFPVLRGAAIIRELHTYGTALKIDEKNPEAAQHKGYGRLLMQTAEDIARREGYAAMAVISGIGVREYYKTLGYEERDTYMVKKLDQKTA